MQVARAAGLSVPKGICHAMESYPEPPHARVSMLMTRIPGREIDQGFGELDDGAEESILLDMERYLECRSAVVEPVERY